MNERLFGMEIFTEIEMEIQKLNNIYPYSHLNAVYNLMVELSTEAVRKVAETKRLDIYTGKKTSGYNE